MVALMSLLLLSEWTAALTPFVSPRLETGAQNAHQSRYRLA